MYVYAYEKGDMGSITITNARKDLYRIVESVNKTHEPIEITGKKGNAVLVGEEDWRSISETLFLTSIPGMRESILQGMKEPLSEMSEELDW
jgi:prevent-host-death family protein